MKTITKAIMLFSVMAMFGSPAFSATNKVMLQISDGSPEKQAMVLNIASNLKKHYGMDKIDVEIVAFGPGLKLALKDNANAERVQSLKTSGVTISACDKTIRKMAKKTGKKPVLNDNVQVVEGGVIRMLELSSQGYMLVHP
ncbi:MAG: DsrE family protein [Gammaproteobacteria bacterium]|nr:DsrE family protein [Gammaproteobacteria bacterium]